MCAMSVGQAKVMKKKLVHCIQVMADVVIEELTKDNGKLNTLEYLAATTITRRLMTVHALSICARYECDKNPEPRPELVTYLTMFLFQELGPYYAEDMSKMPLTDGRGVLPEDFHKHILVLVKSMEFVKNSSKDMVLQEIVNAMSVALTEEVINKTVRKMSSVFSSYM